MLPQLVDIDTDAGCSKEVFRGLYTFLELVKEFNNCARGLFLCGGLEERFAAQINLFGIHDDLRVERMRT